MTLHDEILGRPDCAAALAARDIDTLAAILSNGRTSTQSRFVTARTILAECTGGAALLDALKAAAANNSSVNWALQFLGQDSGLDVGHPNTQAMIDSLAAGATPVLTAAQQSALKNLAVLPQVITRDMVNAAMFNANGTQK